MVFFRVLVGLLSVVVVTDVAHATVISNVSIDDITATTTTITWKTDVKTDATVNYGLTPDVGLERYPQFDRTAHSVTIDGLEPGTTYYFRVTSQDVDGNRATTGGYVFSTVSSNSTPKTSKIVDDSERVVTERILEDLDRITSPEAITAIAEKVTQVAKDVLKPPTILGATRVVATEDTAEFIWTTDRPSNSMVYLVPEDEYDENAADPYTIAQGDPNDFVTKHVITVIGLEPSTVYHFKAVSEDNVGLAAETLDDTFKTRSQLPSVSNVSITRVQETSVVVNWVTPVKAKGVVEYKNMRTGQVKSAGIPVYATNQSLQLSGLEYGTRYTAMITATNEDGENSESTPFSFVTVRDVLAPAISKVNNESTLFPGEDTKIQTILSWETDEPAMCQVFYIQGLVLVEGEKGESLMKEPNPTTAHTQVVVGFAPATVYKFWMFCEDEAGNESRSEDYVLITPVKEKNIIDIILENFEGTFGWLKNVGG